MKMDREIRVRKQGSPLNSPVLLFHSLLWFQDVDPVDLLISSHSTDSSSSSQSHIQRDNDMERRELAGSTDCHAMAHADIPPISNLSLSLSVPSLIPL